MNRWMAATAYLLCSTVLAGAQDAEAEAWLRRQLEMPVFSEIPPNTFFEWSTSRRSTRSAEDVEALKNEVAGRPEHPRLNELQHVSRLLADPVKTKVRVWFGSKDLWRLADDQTGAGIGTLLADLGRNSVNLWCATPSQLNVLDTNGAKPEKWDPTPTFESKFVNGPGFFFSGLDDLRARGAAFVDIKPSEKGWTATTRNVQADWYVGVAWDKAAAQFYVTRVWVNMPGSDKVAGGWTRKDLEFADGRLLARTVEFNNPFERTADVIELVSVAKIDPAVVSDLASIPDPDRVDSVRGDWTFRSVLDLRGGKKILTSNGTDGALTVFDYNQSPANPRWIIPYIAWGVVAAIACIAVFFRFYKGGLR